MELNEILDRLDFPKDKREDITLETFNEHFKDTWISLEAAKNDPDLYKDRIGAAQGVMKGASETALRRGLTGMGMELGKDEIKDKPINEIIDLVFDKVTGKHDELKATAQQGNDEKLTKLQSQFDTLTSEAGQYKLTAQEATDKMAQIETDSAKKLEEMTIGVHVSTAKSRIPFIDDLSDIQRLGYNSLVKELEFTIVDDKVEVTKEGKPFMDDKGLNRLGINDALLSIAREQKLVKVNNVNPTKGSYVMLDLNNPKEGSNTMHPAAIEAANKRG